MFNIKWTLENYILSSFFYKIFHNKKSLNLIYFFDNKLFKKTKSKESK